MPWPNQSWMTRSPLGSDGGTVTRVRAVALPASMSALRVSTFSTEPGS